MVFSISPQQQSVFEVIRDNITESGSAPSYDVIKDVLGIGSKSSIHNAVVALEEAGYLRRLPGKKKSYEILYYGEEKQDTLSKILDALLDLDEELVERSLDISHNRRSRRAINKMTNDHAWNFISKVREFTR